MNKKIINKCISLLLVLALIIPSVSFASDSSLPSGVSKHTLSFRNMLDTSVNSNSVDMFYSDDYFNNSSSYNSHLATASLILTMLTGLKSEISSGLTSIGCVDTIHFGYDTRAEDGVGYSIAKKYLPANSKYLVPVLVRSSNYQDEWIANFDLGETGDAAGYRGPASTIVSAVDKYISDNDLKDKCMIWICGYSRGGAIANLAAKDLSDKYDKSNVFAYCFDSVKASLSPAASYTNIHNIANVNDGVAVVFPEYIGAGVNGNSIRNIGNGDESKMLKMLKTFTKNTSLFAPPSKFQWAKLKINIDPNELDNVLYLIILSRWDLDDILIQENVSTTKKQSDFWNVFLSRIKKVIPDRASYYSIQPHLQNLVRFIRSLDNNDIDKLSGSITDLATIFISDDDKRPVLKKILKAIQSSSVLSLTDAEYSLIADTVYNEMLNNSQFSSSQKLWARDSLDNLLKPVLKYVDIDYLEKEQTLGTLIADGNINRLAQAHYFEVNLAWMMLNDSYYNSYVAEDPVVKITSPKTSISKLSRGKKSFTVRWYKKSVSGYQIEYNTSSKFKKNNKFKTITKSSTTKLTIKKLKKKKRYYVRIRTFKYNSAKKRVYSGWSKYKSVKTK